MANRLTCDLAHERNVPAVVRLEIKSTRASKAGRPIEPPRVSWRP